MPAYCLPARALNNKHSEKDTRKDSMQLHTLQTSRAPLPRRQVLKGLAAATLTLGIAGCTSSSSSSPASTSPTPTSPRPSSNILYTYRGHTDQVLSTTWSPDSKRIASGSRDKTVQVWDALTGSHATTYSGHNGAVAALSWSPDGQFIASGSWDQTVQVWSPFNEALLLTYRKHTGDLTTVAWSPGGQLIASGSADKTVQIWDARTGTLAQIYRGHTREVNVAAWSPDGKYIASGSMDQTAQVWEAATGKQLITFRKHTGEVTSLTWSPDGKYIASGSADKTVQVWEAMTGQILYTYDGYNVAEAIKNPGKGVLPDLVYAVAWSHNGQWIATVTQVYCGDDCGEVLAWDALTEKHISFYPTLPMFTLVISPNDKYFVSAVGVSQVQVFLAPR